VTRLLAVLPFLVPASSYSAGPKPPYHGNFIICSNEDLTLKMTADLSDGKGEKVATAVQNGIKEVFPETTGRKPPFEVRFDFKFYPSKETPLSVTRKGERTPEIRLVRAPGGEAPEVLFDQTDPLVYRMIKFKALLTLKSFGVKDGPVTCTESKWEND
jgi:hypothetical protein